MGVVLPLVLTGGGQGPASAADLPGAYQFRITYSDDDGNQGIIDYWFRDSKERTDWQWTDSGQPTEVRTLISDGQFDWLYIPTGNGVVIKFTRGDYSNPRASYLAPFKQHYYGAVTEEEMLAAAQSVCDADSDCKSVGISGHETIGGEECVAFIWTFNDGSTATEWSSTTRGCLLKRVYRVASTGKTTTMQFTNVDLNPTIQDERFDINAVAPGATIVDMTGN